MLKKRLPDFILSALLLITGYIIAYDAWRYTDIWLYDESMYLSKGLNFNPLQSYFRDGFVYFIWYKLLSLIAGDAMGLYFLNNAILMVAPVIVLYITLRIFGVNILISFLSSLIFLLSTINAVSWPFITKFALMVMMISLSVIYSIKDIKKKLLAAIMFSMLLTYIRPEFILTLFLLCIAYFIVILKEQGIAINRKVILSFAMIIPVILIVVIFSPVTGKRANLAFTQHYVKDINERKGIVNIEGLSDSDSIMMADFGGNVSMREALVKNPGKILTHMKYNFLRLDDHIAYIVPLFIANGGSALINKIFLILAYAGAAAALMFFVIRVLKRKISVFGLIYFLFALPTVLSIIFYYPRTHYTIITIVLVLIFLSVEISRVVKPYLKTGKYSFGIALIIGIATLAFVPLRAGETLVHETSCSTFNMLQSMKQYQGTGNINLLAAGSGIQNYLGKNWTYISPQYIEDSLEKFIEVKKIDIILVNEFLLVHPKVKNDLFFQNLTADGKFRKVTIPNCSAYLIVRSGISGN